MAAPFESNLFQRLLVHNPKPISSQVKRQVKPVLPFISRTLKIAKNEIEEIQIGGPEFERIIIKARNCPHISEFQRQAENFFRLISKVSGCKIKEASIKYLVTPADSVIFLGLNQILLSVTPQLMKPFSDILPSYKKIPEMSAESFLDRLSPLDVSALAKNLARRKSFTCPGMFCDYIFDQTVLKKYYQKDHSVKQVGHLLTYSLSVPHRMTPCPAANKPIQ